MAFTLGGRNSSPTSRYTRSVGLNQRTISIVVLCILTALPVSGTLYAMLCDSSANATASAHHGSKCEEPRPASTGTQIQGGSEHDCSTHDAAVRQASTVAQRADGVAGSVLLPTLTARAITTAPIQVDSSFDYDAPPGTAPPTTTPLVLRV